MPRIQPNSKKGTEPQWPVLKCSLLLQPWCVSHGLFFLQKDLKYFLFLSTPKLAVTNESSSFKKYHCIPCQGLSLQRHRFMCNFFFQEWYNSVEHRVSQCSSLTFHLFSITFQTMFWSLLKQCLGKRMSSKEKHKGRVYTS